MKKIFITTLLFLLIFTVPTPSQCAINTQNAQISKKEYKDLDTKFLVSLDLNENILNEISIGDWVKLKGKLRHPITSTNPYQFDYKKYLLNNDVENILYADKFE